MKNITHIFIFYLFLFFPTISFAGTVTYDFEIETLGTAPNNMTRVEGTGVLTVENDATISSDVLQVTAVTPRTNMRFDSVPTSTDFDVSFVNVFGTAASTDRFGLILYGGSASDTDFLNNHYLVQWENVTSDVIRVYKRTSGAAYVTLGSSPSYPTTTSRKWRVTGTTTGTATTLTVYTWNGSAWVSFYSYTDSSSPYTSGRAGIGHSPSASGTQIHADDFVIQYTEPAGTITVTSPSNYQTFQRSGTTANITITGTYTSTPTAIEASWNGGAYSTIVASPSGGTFSGTLSAQTQGQGSLTVRFTNDTSVSDTQTYVGIGDVFVVAGQSNAEGRGTNNQTYSHATLKPTVFAETSTSAGSWQDGNDATDNFPTHTPNGSVWPLVATLFMADQGVPVSFITTAEGGRGLVTPDDDWKKGGSSTTCSNNCYANMQSHVTASGVNSVKAVLYYQGEQDVNNAISRVNYNSALDTLVANFKADLTGSPKTVVAQLGYKTAGAGTTTDLNNVRLAQSDAWSDNADVVPGPTTYDIGTLSDGVHIATDAQLQKLANRWWAVLKTTYYSGTDGRGPIISSVARNTGNTALILKFTETTGPLLPATGIQGFSVDDDTVSGGTSVTLSSVNRVSDNKIKITLSSAATGTMTVSLGYGNQGGGVAVPTDSSTYNLPAEFFIGQSVSLDSTAPSISLTALTPDPTTDSTPTLSGTATDTLGTVSAVEFQMDGTGGSWSACTADDGTFDEDSETFTCTASTLLNGAHTMYVRATDWNSITTGGGSESTDAFTVNTDTTAPTITNVSSDKTNGSYTTGEVIDIDVTFSETVTSTGNVTVTLETGTTDRTCTFTVSASTSGTCNYTVQAGDTSSDLTVNTISGTIADGASNAMSNFVPVTNLAANKALVIDTTAPNISLTAISPDPTSNTTPTISGSVTDATSVVTDLEYQLDSTLGSWTDCVSDDGTFDEASETFTCTSSGLTAGAHTFYVRATDALSNTSGNSSDSFTITEITSSTTTVSGSYSSQARAKANQELKNTCSVSGSQTLVKKGTRGLSGASVQKALNQMKVVTPALVEDGVIGPKSVVAIKLAQTKLKIVSDGLWGKTTQGVYEKWVKVNCVN